MSFPVTCSYPASAAFPSSASFPATMAWPGAAAPTPPAPELVTRPSVTFSGALADLTVASTLTAVAGSYSNTPTSYTREWRRDGVAIGSATALTYNLVSGDQGKKISFYEKAINTVGDSGFVRATTGYARDLYFAGDSLIVPLTTAIQSALNAEFGADAWALTNVAHSGWAYSDMETDAQTTTDPNIDPTWGISINFDYANESTGLQGASNAATVAAHIFAFGDARVTAGAFGAIYCTSPYRTGVYSGTTGGSRNGTVAHDASELVRVGYGSHGGVALADFVNTTLRDSIEANDGIHWTSEVYAAVSDLIVSAMVAVGLDGDCGGIAVPNAPDYTHLRTYTNPAYIYDPFNPLPASQPTSYIKILSGTGWDTGTFQIVGVIDSFPTADGNQRLYNLLPVQSTGSLSGGVYEFTNTPP